MGFAGIRGPQVKNYTKMHIKATFSVIQTVCIGVVWNLALANAFQNIGACNSMFPLQSAQRPFFASKFSSSKLLSRKVLVRSPRMSDADDRPSTSLPEVKTNLPQNLPDKDALPVADSLPQSENLWDDLVATWKEMMGPAFDDDDTPAALAVKFRLDSLKESDEILKQSQQQELRDWAIQERAEAVKELLPDFSTGQQGLLMLYWQIRWERMSRCKQAAPSTITEFGPSQYVPHVTGSVCGNE
jgi:hypothetical protein